MSNVYWLHAHKREGVARFLKAAMPILRADAQAAGLLETARALEAVVEIVGSEMPLSHPVQEER